MKIHILYPFVDGPWGGANQFLKAIKNYFISIDRYTENANSADIILFNANPITLLLFLSKVFSLKRNNSKIIVVNRVDGPIFLARDKDLIIDKIFYKFNRFICDGTIYQSNWSKEQNYHLGMESNKFETTILNAPNSSLFNKKNKTKFNKNKKIKLISTSWSSNIKKGFEIYQWLDQNLNFNKYEMTFIGNSPVKFKNVIHKEPISSDKLAQELKQSDIFITASQKDPCSNSLIEALHCGLPAIALNDGGHSEIIGSGGEVFDFKENIPLLLEKIVNNYEQYQLSIKLPNINEVGKQYYDFLQNIYTEQQNNNYAPKNFNYFNYWNLRSTLLFWQFNTNLNRLKNKMLKISNL